MTDKEIKHDTKNTTKSGRILRSEFATEIREIRENLTRVSHLPLWLIPFVVSLVFFVPWCLKFFVRARNGPTEKKSLGAAAPRGVGAALDFGQKKSLLQPCGSSDTTG